MQVVGTDGGLFCFVCFVWVCCFVFVIGFCCVVLFLGFFVCFVFGLFPMDYARDITVTILSLLARTSVLASFALISTTSKSLYNDLAEAIEALEQKKKGTDGGPSWLKIERAHMSGL